MSITRGSSRREFSAFVAALGFGSTMGWHRRRTAEPASSPEGAFVHPGMLHTVRDLRRMHDGIKYAKQPLVAGFEKLRGDPHSSLNYQPSAASAEIGRNPNVGVDAFNSDSNAAYQLALIGHITGDPAYFVICSRILDQWAAALKRVTGADAILCAALGGFKMANAAELLRYSSAGWPQQRAEQFGRMLRDVLLPFIAGFAPFANGNWDTAALKTAIAIAIYTDDRALFERALVYYLHGCGNGSIGHYVYHSGQCQESGRDQQHTQLGLGHMGDCCEMAWHQGLNLYGALDNRLLLGFEYTAGYILGNPVRFEADLDRTGKYRHSAIAPRSALRPIYEQIYNHYVKRCGLAAPWTRMAAEVVRPEAAAFQADATGFGTLLYTRDEGPDLSAEPPQVSGLYAAPGVGAIEVSWIAPARTGSYAVVRAGATAQDRVSFVSPETSFRDTHVIAGRAYTYRVKDAQAYGGSRVVDVIAGVPPGWDCSVVGVHVDGAAYCAGSIWRLSSRGSLAPSTARGGGFFVHTSVHGNGRLSARLSPQFASQSLHVGLGLLSDSSDGALLILEPHQASTTEHVNWMIRLYSREANREPILVREQSLCEPAVRYGRLQVALRFRMERIGGRLETAFSIEEQKWNYFAAMAIDSGVMRGGMLLNSGLTEMDTEVTFDDVIVA